MNDCKDVASPVDTNSRLVSSDSVTKVDAPFRKAVGALMHLTTSPWTMCRDLWRIPKKNTGLRSSVS